MEEVVNFMYGKPIKEAPFSSLLEASERFQMEDMKNDVIKIDSKSINSNNALEIGKLAELYNIEQLLQETSEFVVENGLEMNEDYVTPKFTVCVVSIFNKSLKDKKQKEKELQKTINHKEQKEKDLQRTVNEKRKEIDLQRI